MTTTLRIERDGPVARVWLDRPEVRNAMNGTLIRELAATFGALAGDDGVRAIVLGGSGKAFCAGADLAFMREAADFTWEQNHADAAALAEMLWSMYSCPVPVIARIHGDCYAGGLGLASVCDIRVVADAVTFSLSEARLGLLPATISPYVIRAMGEQAARRYFVTAERFGAAEAQGVRSRARGVRGGGDRRGRCAASRRRSSPTGRWRRAPASSSSATSPAARSTPSCAPTPRAASPTSAPAPKAARASRASSTSARRLAVAGEVTTNA